MLAGKDEQVMEENQVVKLAQQGDTEAFSTLVRNYQNKVFGLAVNIVHNHETADDLAQEIFIIQEDINNLREKFSGEYFDVITVNPPYIPDGRGKSSSNSEQLIARHEININLDKILRIN